MTLKMNENCFGLMKTVQNMTVCAQSVTKIRMEKESTEMKREYSKELSIITLLPRPSLPDTSEAMTNREL
ncbi:hypothetical protein WA026_011786 [Henosepilachna vigintioctopunctata]|uniref:Uncharacterized protein n=1 Tax=Henosepilachna vigintioctopunctata TaxID=420089 RepID=A0AAW1UKG2_9CUCU